jgi:FkbM family methyltransferase
LVTGDIGFLRCGEMSGRRWRIFQYWYRYRRKDVRFSELFSQAWFGLRYRAIASRYIDDVKKDRADRIIHLKGIKRPLHVPAEFPLDQSRQVVAELFYPKNWHYYEVDGTKVGRDDIVLDCGAAEGLFALKASEVCKRCYALEPLPRYVETMRRTFLNVEKVEILPYAVGAVHARFHINGEGIGARLSEKGDGPEVEVFTVDELFYEKDRPITYLKADLEGFETNMLKGALRTIEKYRPKIAITTYHREEHAEELKKMLLKTVPDYKIRLKGIAPAHPSPMMLHAWV